MLILFDPGTPAPLSLFLTGHTIRRAKEEGWDRLINGALLKAAEEQGFALLLITDKNLRYQQNLVGRKIAIIVLGNTQWPTLRPHVHRVVEAVNAAAPGSFTEVNIPKLNRFQCSNDSVFNVLRCFRISSAAPPATAAALGPTRPPCCGTILPYGPASGAECGEYSFGKRVSKLVKF